MNIRFVLFDIGNVLALADHQRTVEAFILRRGVPRELASGYFNRPDYTALALGHIDWREYCQRLRDEWGVEVRDGDIQITHANHIYAVDPAVVRLVQELQTKIGYSVVMAMTDTNEVEFAKYQALGVTEPFDHIWRSDEEGILKCDRVAFGGIRYWTERKFGAVYGAVEPAQVLLIDDNPANCAAAAAAGLMTFQYTPYQPWLLEAFLLEQQLIW